MQNPRKQKREERRARIRESWETHYADLVSGQVTLARILGYDDARLTKLAGKGLRLFKIGKLQAALKVFRGLVILDPWVPYFHYLLGSAYEKLGRLDRAEAEYGTALSLTQDLEPVPEVVAFALLGRGRVLGRLGRPAEGLEALASLAGGHMPCADPALVSAARLISEHLAQQPPA